MSDSPEQIRSNIERTRRELGSDVDALADKVTPAKIVSRQTDKVKNAIGSVRDSVMGAASASGESAAGSVSDATDAVARKAKGNPMAVGLIAFGVGWLAASLIPASEKEKELASSLKDAAEPLVQEVTEAAKDLAGTLRQPAQDAAAAVKDAASDAVDTVKSDAATAADDLKGEAVDAASTVKAESSRSQSTTTGASLLASSGTADPGRNY